MLHLFSVEGFCQLEHKRMMPSKLSFGFSYFKSAAVDKRQSKSPCPNQAFLPHFTGLLLHGFRTFRLSDWTTTLIPVLSGTSDLKPVDLI